MNTTKKGIFPCRDAGQRDTGAPDGPPGRPAPRGFRLTKEEITPEYKEALIRRFENDINVLEQRIIELVEILEELFKARQNLKD